ncbi:DUF547 domain-containing protein [uncultured Winogradskyella sp.]|uniref:DUF547 domain-containing protein n=1 Tax=uncultured Winogradskyella sp. TaxID=395353 RepID=UPI00260BB90B|nr:DUF547 domain-containing protein [uncultured Winogradskyella sp.]
MNAKLLRPSLLVLICTMFVSCFSSKGIPYKKKTKTSYTTNVKNNVDHSAWDQLLKTYVTEDGLVDYKGFKDDRKALNNYVTYLANITPKNNWDFKEQLAYFINVYNANTIKLIVDYYPVESIKKVDATLSPFLKKFIYIGDKKFSLADIEKGILQKMKEPRMHFAINCASFSCPKLLRDAYTSQNVDELMDKAVKAFINSDKNKITENTVKLSEIFKWYKKDFLQDSESIIDYINQYANTKISPSAEIAYIEYDWSLNDID